MRGLRQHVARAIQVDQEQVGAGILTDDEVAALTWAVGSPMVTDKASLVIWQQEGQEHRNVLAGLLASLGSMSMHISGRPSPIDKYYLHCADVSIEAYDQWLEKREKA